MSWTCHGKSNSELVDNLKSCKILKTQRVVEAMKAVDRAAFVVGNVRKSAYVDSPLPIGYNATISAPHMHAHCLELMEPYLRPGGKVLDVGSGSGYLTAVFAMLVGASGMAVGVEHIGELVERSAEAARAVPATAELVQAGALRFVQGDGRLGYEAAAPYDCIHVGAAAFPLPKPLTEQLKNGGRMVIPWGPPSGAQQLMVVDKAADGTVTESVAMSVRYVPLTSAKEQLG